MLPTEPQQGPSGLRRVHEGLRGRCVGLPRPCLPLIIEGQSPEDPGEGCCGCATDEVALAALARSAERPGTGADELGLVRPLRSGNVAREERGVVALVVLQVR